MNTHYVGLLLGFPIGGPRWDRGYFQLSPEKEAVKKQIPWSHQKFQASTKLLSLIGANFPLDKPYP